MRGGRISVQQVAADAFGNALGSSLADSGSGTNNPSIRDYVNGMDRASDNYTPASEYGYRNGSDIQSDNAMMQRQRDALYGFTSKNDDFGLKATGGEGLRYGSVRAFDAPNRGPLSNEAELRLINGQTVLDYGDPYAVGGDGRVTADPVSALRKLANALPNMKSGYFTDNFVNKGLNSDVPALQRSFYGATLPLVGIEQMGINLINAPNRIVSALDNLTGIVTQPTTEGKIISGLTVLRDGSEGLLGLAPLVPASRLTAPIRFGPASAAAEAEVMAGSTANTRPSYLTPAEFADLPRTGAIDPRVVRYSQDSAGANFKPPFGSVDEFAQGLKIGEINPASINPVRLVEREGKIFTLDNRRLSGFEQAGVFVPYTKLDAIPKRELFKFTTTNDGTSILMRKGQ